MTHDQLHLPMCDRNFHTQGLKKLFETGRATRFPILFGGELTTYYKLLMPPALSGTLICRDSIYISSKEALCATASTLTAHGTSRLNGTHREPIGSISNNIISKGGIIGSWLWLKMAVTVVNGVNNMENETFVGKGQSLQPVSMQWIKTRNFPRLRGPFAPE